jgi:hypothetical protein
MVRVGRRSHGRDAGVVDQRESPRPSLRDRGDRRVDVFLFGDVELYGRTFLMAPSASRSSALPRAGVDEIPRSREMFGDLRPIPAGAGRHRLDRPPAIQASALRDGWK